MGLPESQADSSPQHPSSGALLFPLSGPVSLGSHCLSSAPTIALGAPRLNHLAVALAPRRWDPTLKENSSLTRNGKLTACRMRFSFRVCSICFSFTTCGGGGAERRVCERVLLFPDAQKQGCLRWAGFFECLRLVEPWAGCGGHAEKAEAACPCTACSSGQGPESSSLMAQRG